MIKDPQKWLAETERLADERGTDNYKLAAEILADLKEAIGGAKGASLARKHAAHLTRKHPTLNHLKSSLRKRGLLN
jgi:predicted RNA polymerase sigma factor